MSLRKRIVVPDKFLTVVDNPNGYSTAASDQFGYSSDASDSYFIVGAIGEDDASGSASGKAYIFNTDGDLVHTLDNPNNYGTSGSDQFGGAVGISESYSIVGAKYEDDATNESTGIAYVFSNTTGNLVHTLENPNAYGTTANDFFGEVVSISENYCVVGVPNEDDAGGDGSGKAYIFNNSTGVLVHTLDNPNDYGTTLYDSFGKSVGITDTHCLVGASGEDDADGSGQGKAYIFNTVTGALLHTLDDPNAYNTPANDTFGWSVGISNTYSIVCALNEKSPTDVSASGAAYVFNNSTGALVHTLVNPNAYGTELSDQFGWKVSISDTYCIVSTYKEDDAGGENSGKAYVYNSVTGALLHTLDNPNVYGTSADDNFGYSIGISSTHAVVCAYLEDGSSGISEGKAYVYEL